MPRDAAIAAHVDARRDDMLAFLAEVVNRDSPTEDKPLADAVGDVFEAKAAALGLVPERVRHDDVADTRVCRGPAAPGRPRALLIGHFDTVYAAGTVAERPFTVAGDRATGCGVLDMKGGLTVALFALEALREEFGALPLNVTFVFNGDEETGSARSRVPILAEAARHDLALVFEPGRPGPALTVARKGVGIFRLAVEGIEAHAGAEPEKGANAIVDLAEKTRAIWALNDPAAGTTVTPGVVRGGTKPYVVPGRAELEIDCRVASAGEQARVERALSEIAASVHVPRTRATLSGSFHRPPMEASPEALRRIALMQEVAAGLGFPLGAASTGGASDGNLTAAAGLATIDGLGPHGARAHSPEEYIELPTLAAKARVVAAFLGRLAEQGR